MKKILSVVLVVIMVLSFVACGEGKVERDYNKAVALMEEGKYAEAITRFETLDGYKNSENRIAECENAIKYNDAISLMEEGKYAEAITKFEELGEYNDSADKLLECKYNNAITLINAEKYIEAYEVLTALGNYKDSSEKVNLIYDNYNIEKIKLAKTGDTVFLGTYEQDNDTSNGKENIEWFVLDIKDNKALVLSKYILDCKPFNETDTAVTWENCTLRKWLNDEFVNTAFSDLIKEKILTETVTADKPPKGDIDPGNETLDKIFLFSVTETSKYQADSIYETDFTQYAKSQTENISVIYDSKSWWSRTPYDVTLGVLTSIKSQNLFYACSNYGASNVMAVVTAKQGVRPAMWIDISK